MSLSDTEKINFITNNFHQYFDFALNQSISTTETVNLVVPVDKISKESVTNDDYRNYHHYITLPQDYNINDILSKYEDTPYTGIKCICTEVIDGDTIKAKIIIEKEDDSFTTEIITFRLVGVNTPEVNNSGYDVSKEFLEKVCFSTKYLKRLAIERGTLTVSKNERDYYLEVENDKSLYLKIDNIRPHGRNNSDYRYYGVLIANKKNINEVILKERLGELWYIPPTEFPSYKWITTETSVHAENFENSNINILFPYFNEEMTNVVFTPRDDPTTIYRYEIYNGVYFIRLQPFSQFIRMHLLPKYYDCSNSVLFLKDDMIKPQINKSNDYFYFKEGKPINSYYLKNNQIRDRTAMTEQEKEYDLTKWINTFCDYSFDIKKSTQSLNNIQICVGYRYNNSSPFYSVHYTGVRDNTNLQIEDRCTLIDANFDTIEDISNNLTQHSYNEEENKIYIQKPAIIRGRYERNIDHVSEVGNLYHKTLKYINDLLYSEEYIDTQNGQEKLYTYANWIDMSLGNIVLSSDKTYYDSIGPITLNIFVTAGERKGLKLYKNGEIYGTPKDTDSLGNLIWITNDLDVGEYSFKVVYDGDDYAEIESNVLNITITKKEPGLRLRTHSDSDGSVTGYSNLPKDSHVEIWQVKKPDSGQIVKIKKVEDETIWYSGAFSFQFSKDYSLEPSSIVNLLGTEYEIYYFVATSNENEQFFEGISNIVQVKVRKTNDST